MSISLKTVEFYITNVCNLTCRGCNRFNNYNFKGHQKWVDHAQEYELWSQRLDIEQITIIGGEPTLNPDLELFALNLRRLWPDSEIMVQTNGTYIKPNFAEFWNKYNVGFAISLHDINTAEKIMQDWKQLFGENFDVFLKGFVFHQASIIETKDYLTLYSNDITRAFDCCDMKYCHTMFAGKLYKCPMTAIIPEFYKQVGMQLNERQTSLMNEYQALDANSTQDQLDDFVDSLNSPIKQCEFCPDTTTWNTALGPSKFDVLPHAFDSITVQEIPFYKKLLT